MNNNNYKINPCKACRKNYDISDINSINQCCYDTLAAFEGTNSINDYRNRPEAGNCQKCILDSMDAIGRTPCDLRMTAYPSWVQVPHYFPALLDKEGDVDAAVEKCFDACSTNKYSNECSRNCIIDSESVEEVKVIENYALNRKTYGQESSDIKKALSNDYVYVTSITISSIIVIFFLVYILSLFENVKGKN